MSAMSRLAGVEAGEGRTAGLMLAHSFFMGLATVFFETAASALFLARFGSAQPALRVRGGGPAQHRRRASPTRGCRRGCPSRG